MRKTTEEEEEEYVYTKEAVGHRTIIKERIRTGKTGIYVAAKNRLFAGDPVPFVVVRARTTSETCLQAVRALHACVGGKWLSVHDTRIVLSQVSVHATRLILSRVFVTF